MIPIIEKEVIEKRKWLKEREFLDILTISESTPGPISVNTATYVGFKVCGVLGSFFATFGLALPSFIIIYVISLFYKSFLDFYLFTAAFKGLKVSVIFLLFNAVLKLKKGVKKTPLTLTIFIITLIVMLLASFFNFSIKLFSFDISLSIILILLGIIIGVISELLYQRRNEL